ncbi:MAG: YggS family pyridoxal phosphate-dependent enzyme [Flavobacteriaceae bacterium]
MKIDNNLRSIIDNIPKKVTLVAVSKTKPVELIKNAYDCGQRDFGENKVQELVNKFELLPKDIKWHMIGHLQRNKVKYIAPFVYLIHSVDSVRLLNEINKQAEKNNKTISVLLQIDISDDNTKFGFSFNEIDTLLNSDLINELNNVKIEGLMGMASFTLNEETIKNQFTSLKNLYHSYKKKLNFKILSMGMSGDYKIAIECGSNLIRLGSSIFGNR